jgi:hypothetical protein
MGMKLPKALEAKVLEAAGLNPCAGLDEAAFQARVVAEAKRCGWEGVYHTYDSRRSEEGYPDLVMLRAGVQIVAELKVKKNKTTPAQEKWLRLYEQVPGCRVFRWRETDWFEIKKELA